MEFKIEMSDFWLDSEQDIEPALKGFIIDNVIRQIESSIRSKIEDAVTKEVKSQVEQSLYRRIATLTSEIIATDKIKGRYTNDPEQTLQEYVTSLFQSQAREKAPVDDVIKNLANKWGEEMKKRYDLLFASQLVAKLSDSGLLKEDAVKLLLDKQ